jgi:hypothetical protein
MEDIMPIDYERAKQNGPRLKAALTRAAKKGYPAVLQACKEAVVEWEAWGAWPDNWSHWQRAIGDAAFAHARQTGRQPEVFRLEEL